MPDEFETILTQELNSDGLLNEAKQYILNLSASKRVRPRFLFACGQLLEVPKSKLINLACAVELIHTASLLHDDIVDQTRVRRSSTSVNTKFGDGIALLAGDQLFSKAILILSDTDRAVDNLKAAAQTIYDMSNAAAFEVNQDVRLTNKQLLSIVDGKTGSLFVLCGKLAGLASNNDIAADKFASIGNLLGRIFQINDDIDDIKEDTKNKIQTIPRNFGVKIATNEAERFYDEMINVLSDYKNHKFYSEILSIVQIITRKNT